MTEKIRLVYFSRATRDMSLSDMKDILTSARENNAEQDICGMLCYNNRYFLQALEGDRKAVCELFVHIADDPRHDELEIASFEYIEKPLFKDWKMGYASSSPLFDKLLTHMEMSEFQPEKIQPRHALALLHNLSSHQDQV